MRLALQGLFFFVSSSFRIVVVAQEGVGGGGNHPVACSDGVTYGYDSWADLKLAITEKETGGLFILCPNSYLEPSSTPLLSNTINVSTKSHATDTETPFHDDIMITSAQPVTIQCGYDGIRENNCTIEGGERHFTMGKNACCDTTTIARHQIELRGITMIGASSTSVYIAPGGYGSYTFTDCIWDSNFGYAAAVLSSVNPNAGDSEITFRNCDFIHNHAMCGPVTTEQPSHVVVDRCLFYDNHVTSEATNINAYCGAAIHARKFGTTLSLSDSCFDSNNSEGPSIVHIDDAANTLLENTNNFAIGNSVGSAEPWEQYPSAVVCRDGIYVDRFYLNDAQCLEFNSNTCTLSRHQVTYSVDENDSLNIPNPTESPTNDCNHNNDCNLSSASPSVTFTTSSWINYYNYSSMTLVLLCSIMTLSLVV